MVAADEADDCVSYDLRAIFGDDGGSELRMRVAMPVLIGWRPLDSCTWGVGRRGWFLVDEWMCDEFGSVELFVSCD